MTDIHEGTGRIFPGGSGASRGGWRAGRRALSDGAAINLQSGLPLAFRDGAPVAPVDAGHLARQRQLKRLFLDIPLSALALLALSPLLLVVAAIVKLTSPGPVMFRQPRVGLDGVEFDILKFRSMRLDATDLSGVRQTAPDDDRVTPVGRFLRTTSIDELPQLWNILRGDMSVIGPRPMVKGQLAAGSSYRQVVPYYDYRHMVRPGLSGWAQANGLRGPTTDAVSARQRIDHDCAYVQNVSLALDLKIILQTIRREFLTGSGL
jgi:lipopolysaccharide/colanic/teichoic acid biosynthesis glycosyltransferase